MRSAAAFRAQTTGPDNMAIALQGERDSREAVMIMKQQADQELQAQLEYQSLVSKSMADITKDMTLTDNGAKEVRAVEQAERQKIADFLRQHDGNIQKAMVYGLQNKLQEYATNVKQAAAPHVLAATNLMIAHKQVLEQGMYPNRVRIEDQTDPRGWREIPFEQQVQMYERGELKTVQYSGAFKGVDHQKIIQYYNNTPAPGEIESREVSPQELRGMLVNYQYPEWYIKEMVSNYESEFYKKKNNPYRWAENLQKKSFLEQQRYHNLAQQNKGGGPLSMDMFDKVVAGDPSVVVSKPVKLAMPLSTNFGAKTDEAKASTAGGYAEAYQKITGASSTAREFGNNFVYDVKKNAQGLMEIVPVVIGKPVTKPDIPISANQIPVAKAYVRNVASQSEIYHLPNGAALVPLEFSIPTAELPENLSNFIDGGWPELLQTGNGESKVGVLWRYVPVPSQYMRNLSNTNVKMRNGETSIDFQPGRISIPVLNNTQSNNGLSED